MWTSARTDFMMENGCVVYHGDQHAVLLTNKQYFQLVRCLLDGYVPTERMIQFWAATETTLTLENLPEDDLELFELKE